MAKVGTNLKKAILYLEMNEVVGIPTETVYGLAGNGLNDLAISKIFQVKNRPFFDPLILHTHSFAEIEKYTINVPAKAKLLVDAFIPGPLTLLLPKVSSIPDLVTAGLPNVAFRIPNHPLTLELLKQLPYPLAAPSANPFGYVSPTTAAHVNQQLGSKIPYILDGGSCDIGLESTIIGFDNEKVIVYRKGGISIEAIEEVVGKVIVQTHSDSNPAAPGMLKSHYAPNKKVVIYENSIQQDLKNTGAIVFDRAIEGIPIENQIFLSKSADLNEAARNIFGHLRLIENFNIDKIYVQLVPETGLGRAINDRIRRAAAE